MLTPALCCALPSSLRVCSLVTLTPPPRALTPPRAPGETDENDETDETAREIATVVIGATAPLLTPHTPLIPPHTPLLAPHTPLLAPHPPLITPHQHAEAVERSGATRTGGGEGREGSLADAGEPIDLRGRFQSEGRHFEGGA